MYQLRGGGSFDASLSPNNTFPAFTRKAEKRSENKLEKLEQCLCQIDQTSFFKNVMDNFINTDPILP